VLDGVLPAVAGKASNKKVLRVGVLSAVKALDPRDAQDTVSVAFLTQVFEAPYAQPPDAETPPRPLLFDGPLRREEPVGDRQVYSGRLRAGVKFSDGTPTTAPDVAASLNKAEGFITQAEARAKGPCHLPAQAPPPALRAPALQPLLQRRAGEGQPAARHRRLHARPTPTPRRCGW